MSNKKKLKNLEEWDKRYRLNNPVYNLNYNNPSFYAGIVASFIGSIPAGFFPPAVAKKGCPPPPP